MMLSREDVEGDMKQVKLSWCNLKAFAWLANYLAWRIGRLWLARPFVMSSRGEMV